MATSLPLATSETIKKAVAELSEVSCAAGENLSGGRLVYLLDDRACYYDPLNPTLVGCVAGMTKNAALKGENVKVQITGKFVEPGLGLKKGKQYFAGVRGTLTLNPTGLKIVQAVGLAIDENTLAINFNSPIVTI
jgi:hypothetical protein